MTNTPISGDRLQKFMIDSATTRGELVELSETWREVLARREYPAQVQRVMGELMAAAALLSANLKFDGVIVMQIHGDGPLQLVVVECDVSLRMRATAKLRNAEGDVLSDDLQDMVNRSGKGRFAITLDPRDKSFGQQAYQGIVPLDGDNVALVIENYMLRSEQLDTRLWLAADGQACRGLLLQRLPDTGGHALTDDAAESAEGTPIEQWNYLGTLGDTLKREEMLNTDIDTLLRRLFWEQDLRVFPPDSPQFLCTCSREKVGGMLKMLGADEVEDTLEEFGKISVDCDFCGMHYDFDAVDCALLFNPDPVVTPIDLVSAPTTRH